MRNTTYFLLIIISLNFSVYQKLIGQSTSVAIIEKIQFIENEYIELAQSPGSWLNISANGFLVEKDTTNDIQLAFGLRDIQAEDVRVVTTDAPDHYALTFFCKKNERCIQFYQISGKVSYYSSFEGFYIQTDRPERCQQIKNTFVSLIKMLNENR